MNISTILDGTNIEETLVFILNDIHKNGPTKSEYFETLALIKKHHPNIFSQYEKKLMYLLGLFYKISEPQSLAEKLYKVYADLIKDNYKESFTPVQASAYNQIQTNRIFSFSAPTSIGKSYLFRHLIKNYTSDIVIIVPSRALISEYIFEILSNVDNSVLVLQFVEDINKAHTKRRIFVLTPERAGELFKYKNSFTIGLFLFDEAQISEENIRGMRFDALVNRIDKNFPEAKKVFTHPFISNPEAQLTKHKFIQASAAQRYAQQSVGKIYIVFENDKFSYFSPFSEEKIKKFPLKIDPIEEILRQEGTLLVYTSKANIYTGNYLNDFSRYINLCKPINNPNALKIINELEEFIGGSSEKNSLMINMMKKGIVVHHGSIPLHGRLLIEKFVNNKFAKICFSTSTLTQGVNMPFDVVWIDNFTFPGNDDIKNLSLKNLIGRAGRSSQKKDYFDYGYVVVKVSNIKTFCNRIKNKASLKSTSQLSEPISNIPEDLQDLAESIINNTFDEENQLPLSQVERINQAGIQNDIKFILENIFEDNTLLTGNKYYKLERHIREQIKQCFINIYTSHLRRKEISAGEKSVLSTSIPILLWRVQGRSFSAIVASRYAYITRADDRRRISSMLNESTLSDNNKSFILSLAQKQETKNQLQKILDHDVLSQDDKKEILLLTELRFSQEAFPIPNKKINKVSLFKNFPTYKDFKYDILVFDTYDYLDKIISFSIVSPICAAFQKYYEETLDNRALMMKNYIKYGTHDEKEIWLQKYGFGFEEIEWLHQHIKTINENEIKFSSSVKTLSQDKIDRIKRYFYENNIE